MSFEGAIVNYNWTDLVLTSVKDTVKVDGESFVDTLNQKWTGKYKWDSKTQTYLGKLQNKGNGNYLAWDSDHKVVTNPDEHWWRLVFVDGEVGFQVPDDKARAEGFYTLELEADKSVSLKYQVGDLIKAQLWHPKDE
jgi:hypothetical protein